MAKQIGKCWKQPIIHLEATPIQTASWPPTIRGTFTKLLISDAVPGCMAPNWFKLRKSARLFFGSEILKKHHQTSSNIIKYIRNQPGNTWCPRAHIWVQFLLPFPCLNYAETKDRVRVRFALEVAVGKLRYPAKVYIQNNKFINILTRHQDLRIKTVRYWPGSCAPNWLHGNAMIVNPATSLFSSLGLQKSGPLLTRANHLQPTRPV